VIHEHTVHRACSVITAALLKMIPGAAARLREQTAPTYDPDTVKAIAARIFGEPAKRRERELVLDLTEQAFG
jgi:hypothetical protein